MGDDGRIRPARAGISRTRCPRTASRWNSPSASGDQSYVIERPDWVSPSAPRERGSVDELGWFGSPHPWPPPRTRGSVPRRPARLLHRAIRPAHAGISPASIVGQQPHSYLPRASGDLSYKSPSGVWCRSSTSRERGSVRPGHDLARQPVIRPARAGISRHYRSCIHHATHPSRASGNQSSSAPFQVEQCHFHPRAGISPTAPR